MSITKKILIYMGLAIVAVVVAYIGYYWFTYIDETTTTGEAYGFVIGERKLDVYNRAPVNLAEIKGQNSNVYIEVEPGPDCAKLLAVKPGHKVMVEALLHDVGFTAFETKDQWDFYVDGSYFNKLSLKFCNGKLCEIYRHRKYFEFP